MFGSLTSDLVMYGVGYHHAGMDLSDRRAIETMFTVGDLPVLCKDYLVLHVDGINLSVCLSVCLSVVRPSVRPSESSVYLQLLPVLWPWGYVKC